MRMIFLGCPLRGRGRLGFMPLYYILILLVASIVALGVPVGDQAQSSSSAPLDRVDNASSDGSFYSAREALVGSETSSGASSPRSPRSEDFSGPAHYPADVSSPTLSPDAPRTLGNQEATAAKGFNHGGTYEGLPVAIAAHPLENGAADTYLQSPANRNIRDAIAQMPQSRDHYLLVSMEDKSEPGGHKLYRFYNEPNAAVYRERIPYVPKILYKVKDIEDEARAETKDDKKAIELIGWKYQHRPDGPMLHDEFVRPLQTTVDEQGQPVLQEKPPPRGAWIKSKLDAARWKLRTHLSDVKDIIAVGKDPSLSNYHTTGGIPAFYGREEMVHGHTIPVDARRVAQERGEVRIFYDPLRPQNQVRLTYTGELRKPGDALVPEDDPNWHTYKPSEDRALPLPKHWRDTHVDPDTRVRWAVRRMKDAETGDWRSQDTRTRWPAKWDAQRAKWKANLEAGRKSLYDASQRFKDWNRSRPSTAAVVDGWRQSLRNLPNRVQNWYRSRQRTEGGPASACEGGACDLQTGQAGQASRTSNWKSTLNTAWTKVSSPFVRRPGTVAHVTAADTQDAVPPTSRSPSWVQTASEKLKTAKDRIANWVPLNRTPTTKTIAEQAGDAVNRIHRRRL